MNRVAKTTANGNWFFGPAEPLSVGMNSKTVSAVNFTIGQVPVFEW